jgi:class 3 adenylate cyclase
MIPPKSCISTPEDSRFWPGSSFHFSENGPVTDVTARPMYSNPRTDLDLETGHILFIDIVGLSRMSALEQQESLHKLSQIIRNTDAGKTAEEELPRLSTGTGLALAFATTADAAIRCAMQISKGSRTYPELKIRMGIHSGPVDRLTEANDRVGVAGPGVNIARRVTDCGDTGHILLSRYAAEHLSDRWHWQPYLHDLGEFEVTNGEVIAVVNFYTDEVGNPSPPKRFKRKNGAHFATGDKVRLSPIPAQYTLLSILFFSVVAIAISYWVFFPSADSNSADSSSGPEVQVLTTSQATPPARAAVLHR